MNARNFSLFGQPPSVIPAIPASVPRRTPGANQLKQVTEKINEINIKQSGLQGDVFFNLLDELISVNSLGMHALFIEALAKLKRQFILHVHFKLQGIDNKEDRKKIANEEFFIDTPQKALLCFPNPWNILSISTEENLYKAKARINNLDYDLQQLVAKFISSSRLRHDGSSKKFFLNYHEAVKCNNLNAVKFLLAMRIDPFQHDQNRKLPLDYACHPDKLAIAKELLSNSNGDALAEILMTKDESDDFFVHKMISAGRRTSRLIIDTLLYTGLSSKQNIRDDKALNILLQKNKNQQSAFDLLIESDQTDLLAAFFNNRYRLSTRVNLLIFWNKDVFLRLMRADKCFGDIPGLVNSAVDRNDITLIKEMVKIAGNRILLKRGFSKLSPLHIAVKAGNIEIFNYLLKHKVNFVRNTSNKTPLHYAAKYGHLEMAELLINQFGESVLDIKDKNGQTALFTAADSGSLELVKFLIIPDKDLGLTDTKGNTLLHIAAKKDRAEILGELISAGANIRAKNTSGYTPLDIAGAHCKEVLCAYLLIKDDLLIKPGIKLAEFLIRNSFATLHLNAVLSKIQKSIRLAHELCLAHNCNANNPTFIPDEIYYKIALQTLVDTWHINIDFNQYKLIVDALSDKDTLKKIRADADKVFKQNGKRRIATKRPLAGDGKNQERPEKVRKLNLAQNPNQLYASSSRSIENPSSENDAQPRPGQ